MNRMMLMKSIKLEEARGRVVSTPETYRPRSRQKRWPQLFFAAPSPFAAARTHEAAMMRSRSRGSPSILFTPSRRQLWTTDTRTDVHPRVPVERELLLTRKGGVYEC